MNSLAKAVTAYSYAWVALKRFLAPASALGNYTPLFIGSTVNALTTEKVLACCKATICCQYLRKFFCVLSSFAIGCSVLQRKDAYLSLGTYHRYL